MKVGGKLSFLNPVCKALPIFDVSPMEQNLIIFMKTRTLMLRLFDAEGLDYVSGLVCANQVYVASSCRAKS